MPAYRTRYSVFALRFDFAVTGYVQRTGVGIAAARETMRATPKATSLHRRVHLPID